MTNDNIALMLLDLSKENEYSNDYIKDIFFIDVIDVQTYRNDTHNQNDIVYCVYADYYTKENNTTATAEFYFTVSHSYYFSKVQYIDVTFLHAIQQH